MFTAFCCARCRNPLRVRDCYQGQAVRCPVCAALLQVPRVSAASDAAECREVRAIPNESAVPAGTGSIRPVVPWLLLAPAALALAVPLWAGYGVLWASSGVGLAALCLLLAQRGGWPLPLRVGVSLSLAVLGHGLSVAGPLLETIETASLAPAAAIPAAMPPHSTQQRSLEPLFGSSATPPRLFVSSKNRQLPPDLRFAAHLGELLSLAVAPNATGGAVAFTTTADGSLKQFSYPDFEWRASYRLEQPAYRAVTDGRGVLWLAASEPRALQIERYGDRPTGRGNIHLYDLPNPRREQAAADGVLHPRRILPFQATVLELLASADFRELFYLARNDQGIRVGRLDPEREIQVAESPLPDEIRAMCLTPDGRTLYAAGGTSVLVLDPRTLEVRRHLPVDADIYSIAADNEGCVYLGEQGQWTNVTRLDLSAPEPVLRSWYSRLHGRIHLKLAPNQERLYVGTSSVISTQVDVWLARGHLWSTPPHLGGDLADAHGPNRGELFLTPDGQFLVNRCGKVFRLAGYEGRASSRTR